jgi:hypothetical protein
VPVKNADRRRELYLKRAQRKKFIEKASPDLGQFLRGLALVPLRPGALAALRVADYDPHLKVLKVGKDKNGQDAQDQAARGDREVLRRGLEEQARG